MDDKIIQLFAPRLNSARIAQVFSRISRTESDCWEWKGRTMYKGYGLYHFDGDNVFVHRLLFAWAVGPIPRGYKTTIDHLCRNRRCCNPVHLELVPSGENNRRGKQQGFTMNPNSLANLVSTRNREKTECKRGHALIGDNLHVTKRGARQCRACLRTNKAASRKRFRHSSVLA